VKRIASFLVFIMASANANAADQILTFTGLGSVVIGMTQAQAEAALHTTLRPIYPDNKATCWFGKRADNVDGQVSYMIENSRIVRIDIDDHQWPRPEKSVPPVATERGIRIGSSTDDVKTTYGSTLTIDFHPQGNASDENYLYVALPSADKRYGLLFEIWEGKVKNLRAGTAETFRLDEPCV
jgi:hypothetical protein